MEPKKIPYGARGERVITNQPDKKTSKALRATRRLVRSMCGRYARTDVVRRPAGTHSHGDEVDPACPEWRATLYEWMRQERMWEVLLTGIGHTEREALEHLIAKIRNMGTSASDERNFYDADVRAADVAEVAALLRGGWEPWRTP